MKRWQKCVVCGAEFIPRNRLSVLCGNPECRKKREAEQKKAYDKKNPTVRIARMKDIQGRKDVVQDPVYNLKVIIDDAIDLYCQIKDEDMRQLIPEEIIGIGKDIKEKTENLIDMAWYKVDSKDWSEKHPGNVGTKL